MDLLDVFFVDGANVFLLNYKAAVDGAQIHHAFPCISYVILYSHVSYLNNREGFLVTECRGALPREGSSVLSKIPFAI